MQHDQVAVVESGGIDADALELVGGIVRYETGIAKADEIDAMPVGQESDGLGNDFFIKMADGLPQGFDAY